MKKILKVNLTSLCLRIILLLLFFSLPQTSFSRDFDAYPQEIKPVVQTILKSPQVQKLLSKIKREGPIGIQFEKKIGGNFRAHWNGVSRKIVINLNQKPTFSSLIASIIYEMHNAGADGKFKALFSLAKEGKVSKKEYVELFEKIEYQNMLLAQAIIDEGISSQIFPASTKKSRFKNFQDYYHYQQTNHHTSWIAETYHLLNPSGKIYCKIQ